VSREGDQKPFFLVVGAPPADTPQLMSTDEFSRATLVRIPTDFRTRPWVADMHEQPVFGAPGSYVIRVSENLESERGGYYCKVRFTGAAR